MTLRRIKLFASLMLVLVITLGLNSAYAEVIPDDKPKKETKYTREDKIYKVAQYTKEIESLIDELDDDTADTRKINNQINKRMKQFIQLTTLKDGTIDDKLLQEVKASMDMTQAASNYNTDFFTTPACNHVATFADPCYGADYQTSEFTFTAPINPLEVKLCSFGPCVLDIAHQWDAPFTWTATPEDLYFDKKYIYGLDLVTGQTTNRLLYGSEATTNWWVYTPVNHYSMQWTTNHYKSGDNTKVIWVPSTFKLGFNAN